MYHIQSAWKLTLLVTNPSRKKCVEIRHFIGIGVELNFYIQVKYQRTQSKSKWREESVEFKGQYLGRQCPEYIESNFPIVKTWSLGSDVIQQLLTYLEPQI
jgi:hypothetical protein